MRAVWRYVKNVLIALDQFANALLGGDPDETISSRLGKWLILGGPRRRAIARVICRALDLVDKGHCRDAIEWDEGDDAVIARNDTWHA